MVTAAAEVMAGARFAGGGGGELLLPPPPQPDKPAIATAAIAGFQTFERPRFIPLE
jgi:hypothetical protein